MSDTAIHVLIGPGPLGLGLLAPVTAECGFEIHLVGSPGKDAVPAFDLTVGRAGGAAPEPVRYTVASHEGPIHAEIPPALRDGLAEAESVLITTSARGGVADRIGFVHAVVDACAPEAEIVFMACENRLADAHHQLTKELRARGVLCLETVVNRACRARVPFELGEPRHVLAYEVAEWMIEDSAQASVTLGRLDRSDIVRLIPSSRVQPEKDHKLLTVNAPHFSTGMLAAGRGQVNMRHAATDPEIFDNTLKLIGELVSLIEPEQREEDLALRCLATVRVFAFFDDDVQRVLGHPKRSDLEAFLTVFQVRVSALALRRAVGSNAAPPVFQALGQALADMLVRGDLYSDEEQLRSGEITLTEEADEAVVAAFRAAVRGWMPAEWIDAQAARVHRALRSQRAYWRHPDPRVE